MVNERLLVPVLKDTSISTIRDELVRKLRNLENLRLENTAADAKGLLNDALYPFI
jgi:hypothetical protein